jgi:hypothetical protein
MSKCTAKEHNTSQDSQTLLEAQRSFYKGAEQRSPLLRALRGHFDHFTGLTEPAPQEPQVADTDYNTRNGVQGDDL